MKLCLNHFLFVFGCRRQINFMKYHILSIGISKHQKPEANLQYAAKDAADFFSLFTQNVANVGYKKLLTDNEATLSSIQTALGNELQGQVGADDGFVLYYSGHGALAPTQDGSFTHFLVPFDVTEDIPNSSIPVDYIRGIFDKLKCKSKLFFVDSCFSGAVNSKSYGPSYKAVKNVKKLSDEISGEGSIVFTACQDEEKSIEDEKLENGVFTSYLLSELQLKKEGDKFSIIDIFTPIAEKVSKYTQDTYHFKQTPTFKGALKEVLYLPTFKKPLNIKPDLMETPRSQNVVEEMPVNPEIDLSSKKQSDIVEKTISFVINTSKGDQSSKLEFDRFALGLGKHVLKKWESIFKNEGGTVQDVPDAVARLEAEAYQLFVLTAVVGAFGNKEQVQVIAEICGDLIKTTRDKSGVIALIHVPEVLVVYIEYLLTLTAIATVDFSRLKSFMATKVYGIRYDIEPPTMCSLYHNHYTSALGGYANKVADYIRGGLSKMDWVKKVHPRLDSSDFESLMLQANFVLVLVHVHSGFRAWPDFARFYGTRILPLVERIKYDSSYEKAFADLLGIEQKDVRKKLIEHVQQLRRDGLGGEYWWNSIEADDFLTKKEIDAREEARRAKEVASQANQ